MNNTLQQLIRCLADGQFHSGEVLGKAAGISRAAVWKYLQQLEALGVTVIRRKGLGYALDGGLSLLNANSIELQLGVESRALLQQLNIYEQTPSTNQELLDGVRRGDVHGRVCLAEQQSAGRGRRGRIWTSPYAANIYLSVGWRFTQGVSALEGLSLAVGVVVCDVLQRLGYGDPQLKWPNDVLLNGRKLAGILLELAGDASAECYAIIGIGLNVKMPVSAAQEIDQPWADLSSVSQGTVDRNRLAAMLIDALLPMLATFEEKGFRGYREAWESRNAFLNQAVRLSTPSSSIEGTMLGVNDVGGLRLDVNGNEQLFLGGEISLRLDSQA